MFTGRRNLTLGIYYLTVNQIFEPKFIIYLFEGFFCLPKILIIELNRCNPHFHRTRSQRVSSCRDRDCSSWFFYKIIVFGSTSIELLGFPWSCQRSRILHCSRGLITVLITTGIEKQEAANWHNLGTIPGTVAQRTWIIVCKLYCNND